MKELGVVVAILFLGIVEWGCLRHAYSRVELDQVPITIVMPCDRDSGAE